MTRLAKSFVVRATHAAIQIIQPELAAVTETIVLLNDDLRSAEAQNNRHHAKPHIRKPIAEDRKALDGVKEATQDPSVTTAVNVLNSKTHVQEERTGVVERAIYKLQSETAAVHHNDTVTLAKLTDKIENISYKFAQAMAVLNSVQMKQQNRIELLERTVSAVDVSNNFNVAGVARLRHDHQQAVTCFARDIMAVEFEVGSLREKYDFVTRSLGSIRSDVDGALREARDDATSLRLECRNKDGGNAELATKLLHATRETDDLRSKITAGESVIADFDNFVKELRKRVQCGICWEILEQPVSLSCGHTLCKECLSMWDAEKKGNCPFCRKWVGLPRAPNYVLKDVVDDVQEALARWEQSEPSEHTVPLEH